MKKGEGKKTNKNSKEFLLHKILIILSIFLIILILGFILILYLTSNYNVKNLSKVHEGTLGTLGIFGTDLFTQGNEAYYEILNVSDYSFMNNNMSVRINLSRSSDNGNLSKLIVIFNKTGAYCTREINSPLPTLILMSYDINANESNCGNNFTGIFALVALGIKYSPVNLTQIFNIPNISMQSYEYRVNAINLNNYFANLSSGDSGVDIIAGVPIAGVQLIKSSDFLSSRKIDINNSLGIAGNVVANITLTYPFMNSVTSNNFNITLWVNSCNESDGGENYSLIGTTSNNSFSGTDYCYNGSHLVEYYCNQTIATNYIIQCLGNNYCYNGSCVRNNSANIAPQFLPGDCNLTRINWYKNENYSLEVSNCFSDSNGDSLSYRSAPLDSGYLNISQNASKLRLVPLMGWAGSGSFYVYASDGLNETRGIIYFLIKDSGTINNNTNTPGQNISGIISPLINQTIVTERLSVKDPSPAGEIVTDFFGKNQTFFISNTLYDSIEWYLDGKLIKTNSNTFQLIGLSKGNHTVQVKITNGAESDSKTWKLNIEGGEEGMKFLFDTGMVMFYVILVVVVIIIGLIIWLFIEERKKKNKKIGIDLNSYKGDKSWSESTKKEDLSKRFNIPK